MRDIRRVCNKFPDAAVFWGSISMEYCSNAFGIEKLFAQEVRVKAFPPNGIAEPNELECYYILKRGNDNIGYIKAIDLFFDGVIEIHGSYCGPRGFLVRTYFELSKKFIKRLQKMFPNKLVRTVIYQENTAVKDFVKWLGFYEISSDEKFITYEMK